MYFQHSEFALFLLNYKELSCMYNQLTKQNLVKYLVKFRNLIQCKKVGGMHR